MDWNNFDFEDLQVEDIISEFDPDKKQNLNNKFNLAISKLDSKSNEELTQLLENLLNIQKEIESIPKNNSHGGKRIQLFLEFLLKFIIYIQNKINFQ